MSVYCQVSALRSQEPLDKIVPPQDTQAGRCVRWLGRPHTTFHRVQSSEFRVYASLHNSKPTKLAL